MFKIINNIPNIIVPSIIHNEIFYIQNNRLFCLDQNFNVQRITDLPNDYVYSVRFHNNKYYLLCDGILFVFNLNNRELDKFQIGRYSSILNLSSENDFIGIIEDENTNDRQLFQYDLRSKKMLWLKEIGLCNTISSDKWIIRTTLEEKNIIQIISVQNGEIVNTLDLKNYFGSSDSELQFNSVNIFFNDTLIKSLTNNTLLSFNISSGKLNWSNIVNGIFFIRTNEKLLGLNTESFNIIQINSGKIEKKLSVVEEYKKNQIEMASTNTLNRYGNYLFFTDNWKSKIGALNTENGIIEWVYKLDVKPGVTLPHAPIFDGDRMYVYDSKKTLHVFEKE
jgi:outer membrane protein assembly factor BamB